MILLDLSETYWVALLFPVVFVVCVCLYLGFPKQYNLEHLWCLVGDVLMNNVVGSENQQTD